jgi:CRP-like cAMP-binding protein
MAMNILKSTLTQIHPLTAEEWQSFLAITTVKELKKGDFFLKMDSICQYSAFIQKGLLRHFMYDEKMNERIAQFSMPHDFISDCESYIQQKPAFYAIQAIENTEMIVFKNEDLQKLSQKTIGFSAIGRQITHQILSNYKEHLRLLMNCTPETRYQYILDNKPELILKLSVTHLSQYLGLSRETVSRMRAKVIL